MNRLLSFLLKLVQKCTGGRPMTKIESAFTDRVSGLAVNKYVDSKGRWWLANGPWSSFRVEAEPSLTGAHKHCFANRKEIRDSSLCGCFSCLATYPPSEIIQWTDIVKGGTAICPRCHIDAVLGNASHYPLTQEFLTRMRSHYFGESGEKRERA